MASREIQIEIGAKVADAQAALRSLSKSMDSLRSDSEKLQAESNRMGRSFSNAGGAVSLLKTALAGLSVGALAKEFVRVNVEFDRLQASLVTVTGSTAAAGIEFEKIRDFAKQTPYQVGEITNAFVKMKAMGLDPSQAALRSYGNTASAMGKGLNQMIEAVADAATGEFERLKEFGIRASKQGDQVSLTFQGVTTTIGSSAAEIEDYLRKIGDTTFAGAMTQQMETLGGKISNLSDSWDGFLRALGETEAAENAESAIDGLTGALNRLRQAISPTSAERLAELRLELQHTQETLAAAESMPIGFLRDMYGVEGLKQRAEELRAEIAALTAEQEKNTEVAKQAAVVAETTVRTMTAAEQKAAVDAAKGYTDMWQKTIGDREKAHSRSLDFLVDQENEIIEKAEEIKDMWLLAAEERSEATTRAIEEELRLEEELAEQQREQADAYQQEWQRVTDQIGQSLTDALMDGGKSAWDYITDLFRTMVLRPIMQPMVAGVSGAIAGTMLGTSNAVGGTDGSTGSLGSFGNLFSTNGFAKNSIFSGLQDFVSTGLDKVGFDAASDLIGGWSDAVFGGLTAGIGAGLMEGLTTGDWQQAGISAVTTGGGFYLGAQLGSFGGPIGAVIGGIAGSFLGGLFGDGENYERMVGSAISTYSDGRAGSPGADPTWYSGADEFGTEVDQMLADAGAAINEGLVALYGAFGMSPELETILRTRLRRTSGKLVGQIVTEIDGVIVKYSKQYGEDANIEEAMTAFLGDVLQKGLVGAIAQSALPENIKNIFATAVGDEEIQFAVQGISAVAAFRDQLAILPDVFSKLIPVVEQVLGAADYETLQENATIFEAMQASTTAYYEAVYSAEEKLAAAGDALEVKFGSLGYTVPQTADEFKALVDALDLTADSGQAMFLALTNLAPAWRAYVDQMAAQQAAVDQVIEAEADLSEARNAVAAAEESLRAAYAAEAGELERTRDQFERFADSLRNFREGLLIGRDSPLSLATRDGEISRRFESIATRAQLGDVEAIEELQSISSDYLEVGKDSANSAEDYYRRFARVQDVLQNTEDVADRHASLAQDQLTALTEQVTALITINDSVLTVADAIGQLQTAGIALTKATSATYSTADIRAAADRVLADNANDWMAVYTAAVHYGVTAAQIDAAYDLPAGSANTWAEANNLPRFALGGITSGPSLAGESGPEAVVPLPDGRTIPVSMSGNDDLIAEVRALRQDVADLKASSAATARNTHASKRLQQRWDGDGMPETREVSA